MKVRYLLHTEPAEFSSTHGTSHVITRPVIHLDDEGSASWAWLYLTWERTNYKILVNIDSVQYNKDSTF